MSHPIKKFTTILALLLGMGSSAVALAQEGTPLVPAALEAWVSPTPDATGAITVIVQPNESLWAIASRSGLLLSDLLALNGLSENHIIQPGDVLIVGYGTPNAGVVPIEEQTATPSPPPPALRATQRPPSAAICISAFDDANRNTMRDSGEALRAGVAFTIFNDQIVVANYITDGVSEPKCLDGLPPGQYHVTRSIGPGELLTTDGNWALTLTADSMLQQNFGSVEAQSPASQSGTPQPSSDQALATASLQDPSSAGETSAGNQQGASPAQTAAPGDSTSRPSSAARWGSAALAVGGGLLLAAAVLILLVRQRRSAG